MRPGTLVRLALAGSRTDTARVLLTAASAALATVAVLSAATVMAIQPASVDGVCSRGDGVGNCWDDGFAEQYGNALLVEPGLRPGVVLALALLCLPVLVLAGQCARLGAPARDRRLAAIRLAGGSPRQAVAVAAAETGMASVLGAGLGVVAYLAGRTLLHRPEIDGRLPLPTDVRLAPWLLASVPVGLSLVASAVAVWLLRRTAFTPFGVVQRRRLATPRPWPGILIGLGIAAIAVIGPVVRYYGRADQAMPQWILPVLLLGGGLLAGLGVVLGTAWISYVTGWVLHRLARRPATLIAARRLLADPWSGSRVFAALLCCVMFGAGAAAFRAWFGTTAAVERESARVYAAVQGVPYVDDRARHAFYDRTLDLVDFAVAVGGLVAAAGLLVFLVESIVSRRRTLAALVATGVPRRVLARATGWQVVAPMVPAIALAVTVGVALPRSIAREERVEASTLEVCTTDWARCEEAGSPYLRVVEIPEIVRAVPVPFGDLAAVGAVALVAVVLMTAGGLLFMRASTDVTELRAS